jgi:hypothetical protein
VNRQIVVTIDCEDRECGNCEKRMGKVWCDEYRKFLRPAKGCGFYRCPACLRGEVK